MPDRDGDADLEEPPDFLTKLPSFSLDLTSFDEKEGHLFLLYSLSDHTTAFRAFSWPASGLISSLGEMGQNLYCLKRVKYLVQSC